MAKFVFKKATPRFVVKDEESILVPNPTTGIPAVHKIPARILEVKNGELITDDPDVIARIRKDQKFGTSEIREITEADEKVIAIKNKKMKEAEEEIAKLRKEIKAVDIKEPKKVEMK